MQIVIRVLGNNTNSPFLQNARDLATNLNFLIPTTAMSGGQLNFKSIQNSNSIVNSNSIINNSSHALMIGGTNKMIGGVNEINRSLYVDLADESQFESLDIVEVK